MKFKVGDSVFLNSGGPLMTVSSNADDGCLCVCEWFDHHGNPRRHSYEEKMLQRGNDGMPIQNNYAWRIVEGGTK